MQWDRDRPSFRVREDLPLVRHSRRIIYLMLVDEDPQRFGSQLLDAHLRGIP